MISGDRNGRSWIMLTADGQLAGCIPPAKLGEWGLVRLKAGRATLRRFFITPTPLCDASAAAAAAGGDSSHSHNSYVCVVFVSGYRHL